MSQFRAVLSVVIRVSAWGCFLCIDGPSLYASGRFRRFLGGQVSSGLGRAGDLPSGAQPGDFMLLLLLLVELGDYVAVDAIFQDDGIHPDGVGFVGGLNTALALAYLRRGPVQAAEDYPVGPGRR